MRTTPLWILLSALVVSGSAAGDVPATAPADRIRAVERLREERNRLLDALRKRREEAAARQELAELRKALDQRQAALDEKLRDPRIESATQEVREAEERVGLAIEQALEADPAGGDLRARIEEMERSIEQLSGEQRARQSAMNSARRRLVEEDPEARAAADALNQAERAFADLASNDPRVIEARAALDAAQKALEAKVRQLPEYAAVQEARARLAEATGAVEGSDARRNALERLNAARERLEKLLSAKLEQDPTAGQAARDYAQGRQRLEQMGRELRRLRSEIYQVRVRLDREDPRVADAREAARKARDQRNSLIDELAGQAMRALDEARRELIQKTDSVVNTDPRVKELRDRIEELGRQVADLERSVRPPPTTRP